MIVQDKDHLKRLDRFCSENSQLSRSKIASMIQNEAICINGKPAKPMTKVKTGDVVTIHTFVPPISHIEPIAMALHIIYEDESLLVVNKPRGLIVHPAKGVREPTLMNGLRHHFMKQGLHHTPGLVHRIDKDTEGLLLIAKDSIAHHHLANQLLDKTLHRKYIAVCHHAAEFETITIDKPIGHSPIDKHKMMVYGLDAKNACSHFTCLENHANFCVLECTLETGRTHQIRVHAASMNHPCIGDPLYGEDHLPRGQALCAYQISFNHPLTNQNQSFTIPYNDTIHYALTHFIP